MRLAAITVATTALLVTGGVAANAAGLGGNPLDAVANATPATLANAALVATTSSGSEAIEAQIDRTTIAVPVKATSGIEISSERGTASVGLPFAGQAESAKARVPGVVSYQNHNGTSTVPIVQRNGDVQINTVIKNAAAPKRYTYPLHVPEGQSAKIAPDGSVYVAASGSVPSLYIGAPWAKDASGAPVSTHYEVNGNELTQVVDFTSATAFPVVADPTILATGQYDYNCVLTNGSSYFMTPGSPLTNCKGSYLQKYINGVMVKSVALVYGGHYDVVKTGLGGCILSLAGVVALVFYPPVGVFSWVVQGSLAAAGIATSCTGF